MNFEYILKIPFESKKVFMPKSRSKYLFSGHAYFLLNKKGEVLRDFVQLDNNKKVTIRPNDNDMMFGKTGKGTDYWTTNKDIRNFRIDNFPNSGINKQVVEITDKNTIDKINDFALKKHSTSLKMEGLLSGSNTSGSDSRIESTPFICTEPKFYGLRFINPLKKQRAKRNNSKASENFKINKEQLERANKIDLDNYFSIFKKRKKEFYHFNPEMIEILFKNNEMDSILKYKIYFDNWNDKKLLEEIEQYKNKTELLWDKYNHSLIEKKSLIASYRGILRTLLLLEKKVINEPILKNRQIRNDSNLDAAHILDVKEIKNNEKDLWKIADINNGILLPKDYHWRFDKEKEFYINEELKIVDHEKIIDEINPKFINSERIKYIKLRNKKYQ